MIPLQSQRNPYIIGRPIGEPNLFFGRQEQLTFIEENLRRGEKVILLHGQRRIGMSSLLHNIPQLINLDKFAFVTFDLEYHSQEKLEYLLENLAENIVEQLSLDLEVEVPTVKQIQEQKDIFCNKFLPHVYEKLKDTNLVLLLDEFDALNNNYIGATIESLFKQLRNVVYKNQRLFVIIFAGRKSADISNLLKIFQDVPIAEVGLLDEESVKQLIIQPAADSLKYEPKAIKAITDLSAGHPYFIQVLCFAVFSRARELEKWKVTEEDVEIIVDKAIELAEAGFAWYWEALSVSEKVVFSAIAEAQKIAVEKKDQKLQKDPLVLLRRHDVLPRDLLEKLTRELAFKGFLNEQANKVKIELVRRWLLQRHPLWQEIRELEKLDKQEIDSTYETLNQIPQISKKGINRLIDQKKNSQIPSKALNHHPQNFDNNISSIKALRNKIYLPKGEIWLVGGITLLGAAAIASFIIIVYAPNQSDRQDQKQNLAPSGIPTSVKP